LKSWQNARLVCTLPLQAFSVLSPTDPILATYRWGEQTRSKGDKKITVIEQINKNNITLTNINTGEETRCITYDSPSEFKSLIFSPNGRILASHTHNPYQETLTIRLWDVSTGRFIGEGFVIEKSGEDYIITTNNRFTV
jgi:WD40 repeat protein